MNRLPDFSAFAGYSLAIPTSNSTQFIPTITKKSSLQISLLILGGLALAGCDKRQTRYEYANHQDCVKDWGDSECDSMSHASGTGGLYYYRNDIATPKEGSTVRGITRGGFGFTGSAGAGS